MNSGIEYGNFEKLVLKTQKQVRAYIAGIGISLSDVDDIAQETYLVLYRNQEKRPEGVEEIRWLKGIAKNLSLNHIRRSKRQQGNVLKLVELLAHSEETVPSDRRVGNSGEILTACLKALSAESRRLIGLRYEETRPAEDIAKLVGRTVDAVRMALFRIRASLKECVVGHLKQEVRP